MSDLNVNDIATWGGSSEPYQIITICMTGAGPAAFIQSITSGYFVAVQPNEYGDLEPTTPPSAEGEK
jgi:hypothetical protein